MTSRNSQFTLGFTLVEMLLVLSLITILAGTVVVSFAGREDHHALAAAQNDFAAALSYAAQQANATRQAHRIYLEDSGTRFRIERRSPLIGEYVPVSGVGGQSRTFPSGVKVLQVVSEGSDPSASEFPDAIEFDPVGQMFAGQVRLVNRNGESVQLQVLARTGVAHVVQ